MRLRLIALALTTATAIFAAPVPSTVTFNKDVLPILQKRCQECHRPGEVAPMALMNYNDARPWAKSIRQAVLTKKMPPWFADPSVGHFANDRSLSKNEIDTLVAWVEGGTKEGNAKDAPPSREFVDGWNMGKPDMVIEMPNAFPVPASGQVEYQYVILPTHLKEDVWVLASEVRPGDRSVMHHVITSIREPGSKWMADQQPGVVFLPPRGAANRGGVLDGGLGGYVPGQVIRPVSEGPHRATLLKAGSDIVFQLHYTPNGKATTDKTKIGLIFAKEPPKERLMGGNSALLRLAIPAGESNYQLKAVSTVPYDSELVSMMPHAHLRGKAFEYKITRPDGSSEVVLRVPKYDFNWQLTYWLDAPIHMPKGTKVELTAWYDNSANNPYNPDPTKEVHWGEQTTEEMMMGYFNYVVDPGQEIKDGRTRATGGGQ
ncbi:MAG: cytochrome c [Acidobacteriia bacterium]|nr:cytochrome c [Terriglobia bacterium]